MGLQTIIGIGNAPVTAAELQPSLLRLSAELRITIYKYALLEPRAIHLQSGLSEAFASTSNLKAKLKRCQASVEQPALVRTCPQIRNEALQIFYSGNDFVVNLKDGPGCGLIDETIITEV